MLTRKDDSMRRTTLRNSTLVAGALLLFVSVAPLLALDGERDDLMIGLSSTVSAERAAAVEAATASAMRDLEPLLPALQNALRDPVVDVRLAGSVTLKVAAMASDENARALQAAAPALIERLADSSPEVRREAADALTAVRPHTPAAASPALLGLLDDPSAEVREAALGAIGGLATATPVVEAALVSTLRGGDEPTVRGDAARALGNLRADGATAVEALVGAVDDTEPYVRRQAVRALGKLGAAAYSAVEALERIARDPRADASLREHAVYALRSIGGVHDRQLPDPEDLRSDTGPRDRG